MSQLRLIIEDIGKKSKRVNQLLDEFGPDPDILRDALDELEDVLAYWRTFDNSYPD